MNQSPRYRLFGGFRLLLALLVLLGHGTGELFPEPTLVQRLSFGNVAVFIFFVLSGFVISEALEGFYPGRPGRFLLNRLLKIVPGYWAALGLTLLVWVLFHHPELERMTPANVLGSLLLFGGDLRISNFNPISISWSLIIEMEFYIAAALLYLLIARLGGRGWWLAAAALFGLAGHLWVVASGGYIRFYGPLFYAPFFVLGAGLYHLERRVLPRLPVFAVTLAALAISGSGFINYISRGRPDIVGSLAAAIVLLVLLAVLMRIRSTVLKRWDGWLGSITYIVYLVHMAFIDAIRVSVVGGVGVPLPSLTAGLIGVAVTLLGSLAAAIGLHLLVETPLMRRRDRLRGTALAG